MYRFSILLTLTSIYERKRVSLHFRSSRTMPPNTRSHHHPRHHTVYYPRVWVWVLLPWAMVFLSGFLFARPPSLAHYYRQELYAKVQGMASQMWNEAAELTALALSTFLKISQMGLNWMWISTRSVQQFLYYMSRMLQMMCIFNIYGSHWPPNYLQSCLGHCSLYERDLASCMEHGGIYVRYELR